MPSSTFEVFPFTGAAFFDTHRFFDPSAKRRSSLTLSTLKGALFDGLCFFGFRKFGVTFAFLWKAWHKSSTSNDLPAFCPLGVSEPRKIIFPGVATFRSERRTGTVFPCLSTTSVSYLPLSFEASATANTLQVVSNLVDVFIIFLFTVL